MREYLLPVARHRKHPAEPDRRRGADLITRPVVALLSVLALSLLVAICWWLLFRWYSLLKLYTIPHFDLGKFPGAFNSPYVRYTALIFMLLGGSHALGYWLLERSASFPRTIKLAIFLQVGLGGLACVLLYPVGALDFFVYSIHLKVALFAQQNPYLTTPAVVLGDDLLTRFAFVLNTPLFYGPGWIVLSSPPALLAGFDDPLKLWIALKLFNGILVLACGLLIAAYHSETQARWRGFYLFAANPFILFEAVGNGHNDILMTFFLLGALIALKQRSWHTGPLLLVAILIKQFAVAVVPVFLLALYHDRWSKKALFWSGIGACLLLVAFVLPFWADGRMLEGMLRGVNVAQNFHTASPFSLAREYLMKQGAPASLIDLLRLAAAGPFLLLSIAAFRLRRGYGQAVALVLILFFLLLSSLLPWYVIPVIAALVLCPTPRTTLFVFIISTLGLLFYPLSVWAYGNSGLPAFQVRLFQALLLALPLLVFVSIELFAGRRRPRTGLEHGAAIPSSAHPGSPVHRRPPVQ